MRKNIRFLTFFDFLNVNGSRSYYSPLKPGSPAPLHNPLMFHLVNPVAFSTSHAATIPSPGKHWIVLSAPNGKHLAVQR